MSTTPSNRGRSPPRPRSPRTTTFHVRGLSESEVTLTNGEYDQLIRDHPEATLTYVDDDDGELITVGSGEELHSRVLELLSYPPPPPPAIFDVQFTSGLEQWSGLFGTQEPVPSAIVPEISASASSSPIELSPVSAIVELSDRSFSPERQSLQPYVEDVNELETAPAKPAITGVEETKSDNDTSSQPPINDHVDEPEPFIASFEAEIQRILEDALSCPPSPRPLSPRPMEEESPEAPTAERTEAEAAGDQQQVREDMEHEPQTSNAGDIISDVFSAMMQSMYRVAQDVSNHASRSLPTTLNETAATAGLQADVINTAVQNFIRQFAEQMHTIANEAMASAQQPLSNPNHPVAVIRTFAENVGHAAATNASRLREDLRDVGTDASVEVRRAGEEMRKAADEMRKAASILGREVGKTGRVVGKVAGGAGREVGKVFGEGAGFVSGFAGGLVRNISGVQGQPLVDRSQVVDSNVASEKEVDTAANIIHPAADLGQLSALHPLIPQSNTRRELPSSPPPPPPPPHGIFSHPLPPPPPPPPLPFHSAHPLPPLPPLPPQPPHIYQGFPPIMPFNLPSMPVDPSPPPHRSQSLRSGPSSFATTPHFRRSFPYGGPKVPSYREAPKATSVGRGSAHSHKTGASSSSSSSDSETEPNPSSGYQYVTPGIGNNEREAWKRATTFEPALDATNRWRQGQEHNRQRRGRWECQGRRFSGSDGKSGSADASERNRIAGDWQRGPPHAGPSRFRSPYYAAYPHPPQPQQAAAPPPPPPPKPVNFHPTFEPPPPPPAPMLIPVKDPFSPVRKSHSPVELDDSRGYSFGSRGRGRKRHTVNIPGSYARVALSDSNSEGASDSDVIPRRSKGKQAQRFADDLSSVSSFRSRRGSDADSVKPPGVTFPGLRKVKTTTDSFGRESAAPTRPWLAPWDEQPSASAGEDAMRRFPSLSELNDSLFSQTSPPATLPVLTRFPPTVPSPPNPFSNVPGYWPGSAPSPPARNPFAGGLIDLEETSGTLKRLPGGFPDDDEADRATPVPRPLPKLPENDDLREIERMRLVEGVEESVRNADVTVRPSVAPSVSVEEVPDESELASAPSVPFDFPEDVIEKCVKTLIELGYVEVGTERLRMFSELAKGSVEDAVDMLEEERHNWAQFWQQAERNADPQQF